MQITIAMTAAAGGLAAVAALASQPESAPDWADLARADIEAAHQLMLENHPGPIDVENPGFMAQAEQSLETALELASRAATEPGYVYALRAYGAGFRDGHFGIRAPLSADAPRQWAGLIVGWRADRFTVVDADPETSLIGAELVSCDGRAAADMLIEDVFRFDSGKPDQPAYWARLAPRILIDEGNPFAERASACLFRAEDGAETTEVLNWRAAPDDLAELRRKATFGERPAPSLREFAPGKFWINLPNFGPQTDDDVAAVRSVIEETAARRPELRDADAIVADVRGNQGGSSAWGVQFAEALWGEDYVSWRAPGRSEAVDWRASPGNIEHMDFVIGFLKDQGQVELAEEFAGPILDGMREAHAEGREFFRETSELDTAPRPDGPIENPVNARVFFLTHGYCGSACLDFADTMLSLEGVTHIGYPTASDTNYLEVRSVDLPSGRARLVIPIKVYRNRPRANAEYYRPEIIYNGFDWSDAAMEDWVREAVLH
ncbi:MAG: S41 family peptidase [Parvularculaceae bacterium]